MSRPPSWKDWLPFGAIVGPGVLSVLAAPVAAVEEGRIVGLALAVLGLVCLLVSLLELKDLFVARVRWVDEQQIAEIRGREVEVLSGGDSDA
jgi:hypothetical protein